MLKTIFKGFFIFFVCIICLAGSATSGFGRFETYVWWCGVNSFSPYVGEDPAPGALAINYSGSTTNLDFAFIEPQPSHSPSLPLQYKVQYGQIELIPTGISTFAGRVFEYHSEIVDPPLKYGPPYRSFDKAISTLNISQAGERMILGGFSSAAFPIYTLTQTECSQNSVYNYFTN